LIILVILITLVTVTKDTESGENIMKEKTQFGWNPVNNLSK